MTFQLVSDQSFKNEVDNQLFIFFKSISSSIENLDLDSLTSRKNPMLMATMHGMSPESFVQGMLSDFRSSSYETHFGTVTHNLMTWLLTSTGRGTHEEGKIDCTFNQAVTPFQIMDGASGQIKSGQHFGNSDSREKMDENLVEANPKEQIVLYAYGSGRTKSGTKTEYAGQDAWHLCSDDIDCYLKFQKFVVEFQINNQVVLQAYNKLVENKLLAMIEDCKTRFVGLDGLVDYIAVVRHVSSRVKTTVRAAPIDPISLELKEAFVAVYRNYPNTDTIQKEALYSYVSSQLKLDQNQYGQLTKALNLFLKNNEGKLLEVRRGPRGGVRRLFDLPE